GHAPAPDRTRRAPQPRRPSRRAAQAAYLQPGRLHAVLRPLHLAERRHPRRDGASVRPGAPAHQRRRRRSARGDRELADPAEAGVAAAGRHHAPPGARGDRSRATAAAGAGRHHHARDGRRDSERRRAPAGDPRRRRAVRCHHQGLGVRRAAAVAAVAAVAALRLRAAGLLAARAPGRAAADAGGAVPLRGRRGVRLLHRPAASHRLPAELQRRPVRHPPAGARLLPLLDRRADRHGSALPDPRRHPRGDADGHRQRRAAAQEPPLRGAGDRRAGDAPARYRSDHDGRLDGAAGSALRGLYPLRRAARPALGAGARARGGRGGRARTRRDGRRRRRPRADVQPLRRQGLRL
ncbi:MAG: Twin-arginine translocation protein TatC, partial [uncultured Solirubrobacteraceae bacterium]